MTPKRLLILLAAAALALAGCGSGAASNAPAQTSGGVETPGSTVDAGPTDDPGPGEPTDAPPATTSGGGPSSSRACDLLTADEVEQATGFPDIKAEAIGADATDALSGCAYLSGSTFPAAIVSILDPENTNTDPAGYLALPGSEEVAVSGARAVWVPAAGNVMFLIKGGTVVTLQITPQEGEFKDAAQAIVQKVADRL